MNWDTLYTSVQSQLGDTLPNILGALAILALGWLVALLARAGVRRCLGFAGFNRQVQAGTGQSLDIESAAASVVFWLILLFTLVAVFNVLDLGAASVPLAALVTRITDYLPQLLGGAVIALVAWVGATVLRALAQKALTATTLDERLSAEAGMQPVSRSLADVVFWLVILFFLPAILGALELRGLLDPVQGMLDRALQMVPDIFAAAVIGFVGWIVAKVLRALVSNLLAAAGADSLGQRIGLHETVQLSRLAGMLVFILVFVPSLIAALDALHIEAISRPATDMLYRFFDAVPNIVAAAVILTLAWYVASFASGLLARLLAGLGADALPERIGLAAGSVAPSRIAAALLLFFAMLFATVEAANQLGFTQVRDVVTMFIQFAGDVLLGSVILVIGFWLSDVAYQAVGRVGGEHARGLAAVARAAILGLVIAMGLRAMGIADDIVNLAFGLTLGAVAVAVALSFGLGGREAAGRQMEYWLSRWRGEK